MGNFWEPAGKESVLYVRPICQHFQKVNCWSRNIGRSALAEAVLVKGWMLEELVLIKKPLVVENFRGPAVEEAVPVEDQVLLDILAIDITIFL